MRSLKILMYFLLSSSIVSIAQTTHKITGKVIDQKTKLTLSYVPISLKNKLISTITNGEGEFNFIIPTDIAGDTLMVSYLGYETKKIPINKTPDHLIIKLNSSSVPLNEVTILALSPTYYIKMAMNRIKENYPISPFESEAYYKEKVTENSNLIRHNEAVFKTYYPFYVDTNKNQNQLLLFRKESGLKEISFMQGAKRTEGLRVKGKTSNKEEKSNEDPEQGPIKVESFFGGPEYILKMGKVTNKYLYFLDSLNFKKFNYSFNGVSNYKGKELIIINFEAKKAIKNKRFNGSIYLERESYAIVHLTIDAIQELTEANKVLLFTLGYKIPNPTYCFKLNYQEIGGKWYPQTVHYNLDFSITKKHLSEEDEQALFNIQQLLSVNKIMLDKTTAIPPEKRFDPALEFEDQVFNDEKLSWSEINAIN